MEDPIAWILTILQCSLQEVGQSLLQGVHALQTLSIPNFLKESQTPFFSLSWGRRLRDLRRDSQWRYRRVREKFFQIAARGVTFPLAKLTALQSKWLVAIWAIYFSGRVQQALFQGKGLLQTCKIRFLCAQRGANNPIFSLLGIPLESEEYGHLSNAICSHMILLKATSFFGVASSTVSLGRFVRRHDSCEEKKFLTEAKNPRKCKPPIKEVTPNDWFGRAS